MRRLASLALSVLAAAPGLEAQSSREGFALCALGRCINCFYCDGECFAMCQCYNEINTCCCAAAPGHYSRGYGKIPCPPGTYQDERGQAQCKPCSGAGGPLYNRNYRDVAVGQVECEFALCDALCNGDAQCEQQNCGYDGQNYTSELVMRLMRTEPPSYDFCNALGIVGTACTWLGQPGAARGSFGSAAGALWAAAAATLLAVP